MYKFSLLAKYVIMPFPSSRVKPVRNQNDGMASGLMSQERQKWFHPIRFDKAAYKNKLLDAMQLSQLGSGIKRLGSSVWRGFVSVCHAALF